METLSLNYEFDAIIKHYLNLSDNSILDTYGYSRNNLCNISVIDLNSCASAIRQFLFKFTGVNQPELNEKVMSLLLAINFETRRRPLSEQYPELYEPLWRANETLDRISIKNNGDFEVNFTDILFDCLKEMKPENVYINLSSEVSKKLRYPPKYEFDIDGLIYDETDNILYMVESYVNLTPKELSRAVLTREKFEAFIRHSERTNSTVSADRTYDRIWLSYFGEFGVLTGSRETIHVEAYIGFYSAESGDVLDEAAEMGLRLIGPHVPKSHLYVLK